MRAYISADGLIVQSDKVLKWDGWREVTSANQAPMPVCIRLKKREKKKELQEEAVEQVAPVQQDDEDDSDLDVPVEPEKKGKKK